MFISIGTAILTLLGILLLAAVSAGFGVLFFLFGWACLRGFPDYVREQHGAKKLTTALIFGPFVALFAFVGLGIGALCALVLPMLLFAWLAPRPLIAQVDSWISGQAVTVVLTHVATIGLGLCFFSFALGVSLTFLLSIPEMVRTLRTFFDFIAVLFALGLGIVFLYISIALFAGLLAGTM